MMLIKYTTGKRPWTAGRPQALTLIVALTLLANNALSFSQVKAGNSYSNEERGRVEGAQCTFNKLCLANDHEILIPAEPWQKQVRGRDKGAAAERSKGRSTGRGGDREREGGEKQLSRCEFQSDQLRTHFMLIAWLPGRSFRCS